MGQHKDYSKDQARNYPENHRPQQGHASQDKRHADDRYSQSRNEHYQHTGNQQQAEHRSSHQGSSQMGAQPGQYDAPQYQSNQQGGSSQPSYQDYNPTQQYGGGTYNPYANNPHGSQGAGEPWRNDSRYGNDPRAYSEDFSHAGYGGYGVSSENQSYGQSGVPRGGAGRQQWGYPGGAYEPANEQYRSAGVGGGGHYQSGGGSQGQPQPASEYQPERFGYPNAQSNFGHGGGHEHHFDPHYRQWRAEHIRQLDEEYMNWRQESYGKFAEEFDQWRSQRQTPEHGKNEGKAGKSTPVRPTQSAQTAKNDKPERDDL